MLLVQRHFIQLDRDSACSRRFKRIAHQTSSASADQIMFAELREECDHQLRQDSITNSAQFLEKISRALFAELLQCVW